MIHAHHHHHHRPEHRSRREIDQAIGVLMGLRRYSAEEALTELANAVRASGIGLGGVSRALLDLVTGSGDPAASAAVAHWDAVLRVPTRDASA